MSKINWQKIKETLCPHNYLYIPLEFHSDTIMENDLIVKALYLQCETCGWRERIPQHVADKWDKEGGITIPENLVVIKRKRRR